MTRKKLIVLSVGAACAWPMFAAAAGHWEVITPSSVDESAPQLTLRTSHLGTPPAGASMQAYSAPVQGETVSMQAADESLAVTTDEGRMRTAGVRRASLPNPQTPWSPNESGTNRHTEDMQAYRQHVVSVEETRIAAEASYAVTPVASTEPAAPAGEPALASSQTTADIDRLLQQKPETPSDREPLVSVNPALVDSRQSATNEIRVETVPNEKAGSEASAAASPQVDAAAQSAPAADVGTAGATTTFTEASGSFQEKTAAAAVSSPTPAAEPLATRTQPAETHPAAPPADTYAPAR